MPTGFKTVSKKDHKMTFHTNYLAKDDVKTLC